MLLNNKNYKIIEPCGGLVSLEPNGTNLQIYLSPSPTPIKQVRIKWFFDTSFMKLVLADTWGVALADLGWRTLPLKHAAQWYFAVFDGEHTYGFGVKTGCNSFCSWEIEADGITLICDTRNGGEGVELTERLLCAETVCYLSSGHETPYQACCSFCRLMCDHPVLPNRPIYGFNTWYYTYGNITRDSVLEDARLCARLASKCPPEASRPFMVIDDGWNKYGDKDYNGGPFVAGDHFGDMASLAKEIREIGCEPGIWVRPMLVLEELCPQIPADCYSENQQFPQRGKVLDPTTQGAREYIKSLIGGLVNCGYRLIKHDFTCPDLMGKSFLDPQLTHEGWHWKDRTKTNAQVFKELYTLIQETANGAHVIGCNIYNHLAAGIHDIVRSGCDTSGHHWEITRDYGINTLAFRLCQNQAFFMTDADCAAFTEHVPTELNLHFSELLSMSNSAFFISAAPGILTPEEEERLMEMFRRASLGKKADLAPIDWMERDIPERYVSEEKEYRYHW